MRAVILAIAALLYNVALADDKSASDTKELVVNVAHASCNELPEKQFVCSIVLEYQGHMLYDERMTTELIKTGDTIVIKIGE